jgi:hypothetical protein
MISAEQILDRFWAEIRQDPRLVSMATVFPADHKLDLLDALPLAGLLMAQLRTPDDQVQALDALAHAYARASGLHFTED